jgi:serine O-acetyltransferase
MPRLTLIARTAAEIRRDVAAVQARDPAAQGVGTAQILAVWPGVHALLAHRVAHALYGAGAAPAARMIATIARSITGIEIHPAACIGAGFFVDHGMGVVVGETAEIGDNVTLYQGVTLGGTGFATGKRHPTVQDNVTIGSGAKLLGPIVVGHGAKIGANSVVIHDVPPNATVVGNPGHPVRVEGRRPEGPDADWIHLPDPVAEAIKGLSSRIAALETDSDGGPAAPGNGGSPTRRRVAADGSPAAPTREPDGRANPAVGPNPAGG